MPKCQTRDTQLHKNNSKKKKNNRHSRNHLYLRGGMSSPKISKRKRGGMVGKRGNACFFTVLSTKLM